MPGGRIYTPREVEYITKAVKMSVSADVIARKLGRKVYAVELKIRQMKTAGLIPPVHICTCGEPERDYKHYGNADMPVPQRQSS